MKLLLTFPAFIILVTLSWAAPGKYGYGPGPGHAAGGGQSEVFHQQDHRGYGTYRFGYKVDDPQTYNHQSRHEEKDENGVVRGSYSLLEPDGNVRMVHYVADKYGFRAFVKNSHKPDSVHGETGHDDGPYGGPGPAYGGYH